jgi:hypothetical protein
LNDWLITILTYDFSYGSLLSMTHDRMIRVRQKLLSHLPVTGEILRGSLLERTVRSHASGCAKCTNGEGRPLWVLTVRNPGGRTRQFSVGEVRRWLDNYQKLKAAIEAICEFNHNLLRPERSASKARRSQHD